MEVTEEAGHMEEFIWIVKHGASAVCPRDEEEFRFTQVEFEVMSSCPSRDDADIQR